MFSSRSTPHTKLFLPFVACLTLSISLVGCQKKTEPRSKTYPFEITTTVGMVGDIVRQVAGDKANVTSIIGTGVDPHLYRPTRDDVAKLLAADVIFYNGLMLEGRMADTLSKVASGGKPTFAVTELLDEEYLLTPATSRGHHDPHVWMDVRGWMKAVETVATSLSRLDPDHETYYRDNADRYLKQLEQLDAYVRQVIESIPADQRILVTAHDAFSYFGRAYGIEVRGIQGISTESEAGLQDINNLVDLIVNHNVRAVFVETSLADKSVRALIEAGEARGRKLIVGGNLYSDAMGAAGTYQGTYIGMIDHNATTIARALGGQAPEKGMQGKL